MASFDYRLNPLYTIKECSSCGSLYTIDYCCSNGSLVDKIICDLNKAPDSPHLHMFSSNQRHCFHCKDVLGDGDHIGYNCPPKASILSNPEPCNQTIDELPQTFPSSHPTCYSGDKSPFTCDSTPNYIDESPNLFNPPPQPPVYSCEFYENDARHGHYCTPQVSFIYPKLCYSQDINFPQYFHDFQQQYLCCENCGGPHEAYQCQPMNEDYYHEQNSYYDPNSFGFDQIKPSQYTVNHPIFNDQNALLNAQNDLFNSQNKLIEQLTSMCDMVGQYIQKKEEGKRIEEEQVANARYWKIPICYDDDEDYSIAITPKELDNSLILRDEQLDTILATESNEFIKSSVENHVPNPSESEGEHECDVPACDDFTTFSNILFDADYDFSYSDDKSCSDEDISKKIYSNPLFDEEIISIKIDPHHFNADSDLIESMLNQDSSIIYSSLKIDSLLDEFAGELILLKSIPPGIDKSDCDPEEEIRLV
nr:hypothetical protein [Tanacetum cinerariifolium]